MMKYIWAAIAGRGSVNRGNFLVEECLKQALHLPEPDLSIDIFREKFPENLKDFDFVINPGSTTFYPDYGSLLGINSNIPIICFGGSIWIIEHESNLEKLIVIAKKMWKPVGCRDPFTYELLQRKSIKAEFIGCPTLLNNEPSWNRGYIAFSFGRRRSELQIELLRYLLKLTPVKVLIHEKLEEEYCRELEVEKYSNREQFLRIYSSAKSTVTGRLHAALPSIALSKPTFFFKTEDYFDSRLTILDYIRLPIREISEMYGLNLENVEYDREKVALLKRSFSGYIEKFHESFDRHSVTNN